MMGFVSPRGLSLLASHNSSSPSLGCISFLLIVTFSVSSVYLISLHAASAHSSSQRCAVPSSSPSPFQVFGPQLVTSPLYSQGNMLNAIAVANVIYILFTVAVYFHHAW